MSTTKINNVELEYNSLDADTVEKAEDALERVKNRCAEIGADKSLKLSQGIREICKEVFECFNMIFGDGTDKKIFGDTCDLGKAMDAFGQLAQQIVSSQRQSMTNLTTKYAPNREARRHSAKK